MKFKLAVFFILFGAFAYSQQEKPKNYRRFDDKTLHFGFMLGFNRASFNVMPVPNAYELYGLKAIECKAQPGGQIGIVSTLKLGHPVVRLRFIPTLSFQERVLNYYYTNPDPAAKQDKMIEERVNSTNLDFPLMLQFRTLRYNNFAAYVLAGAQYSYDLQSMEKSTQSLIDPFIKIKASDIQGQVGGGVEFFAPYFKFGMEIKYSQGFSNSLIQDNTTPSRPLDQLFNRVLWVSLIFEG
jgi:hypothetical protein